MRCFLGLFLLLSVPPTFADVPIPRPRPPVDQVLGRRVLLTLIDFKAVKDAPTVANCTEYFMAPFDGREAWEYSCQLKKLSGDQVLFSSRTSHPSPRDADIQFSLEARDAKSKGTDWSTQVKLGDNCQAVRTKDGVNVVIERGSRVYRMRTHKIEIANAQALTQILQAWLDRDPPPRPSK